MQISHYIDVFIVATVAAVPNHSGVCQCPAWYWVGREWEVHPVVYTD